VADFVALGLAGEATPFAWPLTQPTLTGVAVVAEIHCQFHNRSHQAFREYDQPSVIMEDIHEIHISRFQNQWYVQ
jgi:hypothetical protein